jgi:hypothetical protein
MGVLFVRDFPFWRGSIYRAKNPLALKATGEDIVHFPNEPLFYSHEPKLTQAQVAILHQLVSEEMNELIHPGIPGPASRNWIKPEIQRQNIQAP